MKRRQRTSWTTYNARDSGKNRTRSGNNRSQRWAEQEFSHPRRNLWMLIIHQRLKEGSYLNDNSQNSAKKNDHYNAHRPKVE